MSRYGRPYQDRGLDRETALSSMSHPRPPHSLTHSLTQDVLSQGKPRQGKASQRQANRGILGNRQVLILSKSGTQARLWRFHNTLIVITSVRTSVITSVRTSVITSVRTSVTTLVVHSSVLLALASTENQNLPIATGYHTGVQETC